MSEQGNAIDTFHEITQRVAKLQNRYDKLYGKYNLLYKNCDRDIRECEGALRGVQKFKPQTHNGDCLSQGIYLFEARAALESIRRLTRVVYEAERIVRRLYREAVDIAYTVPLNMVIIWDMSFSACETLLDVAEESLREIHDV